MADQSQFPIQIQIKRSLFLGYKNKPGDPYNNNIAHPTLQGAFNCDICSGYNGSNDVTVPPQCPGTSNNGGPLCSSCNSGFVLPCAICSALGLTWATSFKGLPSVAANLASCVPDQGVLNEYWVKQILTFGADNYNLLAYR